MGSDGLHSSLHGVISRGYGDRVHVCSDKGVGKHSSKTYSFPHAYFHFSFFLARTPAPRNYHGMHVDDSLLPCSLSSLDNQVNQSFG